MKDPLRLAFVGCVGVSMGSEIVSLAYPTQFCHRAIK